MIPQYLIDFELNDLPVVETDVIVIGSGIAGLYTAIMASATQNVPLITKKSPPKATRVMRREELP